VRDGVDVGYLRYRRKSNVTHAVFRDEVRIEEVFGDARARRSLYRFVLSIDLVATVTATNLPPDEVFAQLVHDRRRVSLSRQDGLWTRIVDVPVVLRSRAYDRDGEVVLGIRDHGTTNTVVLRVENGEVECGTTFRAPQVVLSVDDLSSLFWGDVGPELLADAGRIDGDAADVARLGDLMRTPRAPWCPEIF
jgi:predicted acetyltransferase